MIDLRHGDCLEKMKEIEDRSVDLILCDPPYELTNAKSTKDAKKTGKGFMGKAWDGTGIAFNVDMWKETYRLLKDDGYLMAFSGTRTYHRMAKAIEEAGFEIVGITDYCYGSGFPKALSIDKALDKLLGATPEIVGRNPNSRENCDKSNTLYESGTVGKTAYITKPSSDIAKQYEGYKTSLKPSREPIVVAKKKSNTNNIDLLPFVYCAKASKKERNGDVYGNVIDGLNNHPTVKSLKIMKECAKQVIKDKDITILDMFAGSGSTGVAIEQLNIEIGSNHKCILIEREEEYIEIIKKRCCIEELA